MTKYQELVEAYQEDIEKIKALKAKADAALEKVNEHDKKEVDWYDDLAVADHQIAGQELYEKWQRLHDDFQIECDRLRQDIDAEYAEVPFAKPRLQGVEKFWELTGIR